MRKIWKLFRFLIISLGAVCALALIGLAIILKWPELAINPSSLRWGADFVSRYGIQLTWKDAQVSFESPRFLRKKIDLGFNDLCIKAEDPEFDSCFKAIHLSAVVSFTGFKPRIIELGPAEILEGDVSVKLPEPTKASQESSRESQKRKPKEEFIPHWIREAKVHPIHVDISKWKVQEGRTRYSGELELKADSNQVLLEAQAREEKKRPQFALWGRS